MAINLQDLKFTHEFQDLASLLQESRTRWLTDVELEILYQQNKNDPCSLPLSKQDPPLKKAGIYFISTPAFRDKNVWDPINGPRNTQSTHIYHTLPDYTTTVASKQYKNVTFVRRTQRCSKSYKKLAIIHYRWVKDNGEIEVGDESDVEEKEDVNVEGKSTKHPKSKLKATAFDGKFKTILSYSSSSSSESAESSQQQKKVDISSDSTSSDEEQKSEPKVSVVSGKQGARLTQQELREEEARRTLHLSNLSLNVAEIDIAKFFDGVGQIRDIRMPMRRDGIFKSFAFVEFDSAESAQAALKLHNKPMLSRPVLLARANPRGRGAGSRY